MYSKQADKHMIATPKFEVGDEVWLLRKNVKMTQLSSKLDFKRPSKFRITKKVFSHAYKLKLLALMKMHSVFHISLLEPTSSDPLLGKL